MRYSTRMGIFSKKIGIDLGTANTLVYIPERGIILNEPSVVAISQSDRKVLAVGIEAKSMLGKTPEDIIAYRPMKDGVIADYRVTEAMLRYFIHKALGKWNFVKPDVMISVPVGITSTEHRAVVEAAMRAGAKSVAVVREAILAALGAGVPIEESKGQMIVDIGGGTTDVALISLGSIVAAASVKCAGDKIDHAIADYIKKTHNLAIGERTAEQVKMHVASAVEVPEEEESRVAIKGRDIVEGLPKTIEISTNEICHAIDPELKKIIQAIKDVLAETPPELSSDIIDHGIVLTGGTSQLARLPELIMRTTGVKARLAEDPLYCVAKGTGVALKHLDTYKKAIVSKR